MFKQIKQASTAPWWWMLVLHYLNALFTDGKLIKGEDGTFNDMYSRQNSHADVDGIAPLRIKH